MYGMLEYLTGHTEIEWCKTKMRLWSATFKYCNQKAVAFKKGEKVARPFNGFALVLCFCDILVLENNSIT